MQVKERAGAGFHSLKITEGRIEMGQLLDRTYALGMRDKAKDGGPIHDIQWMLQGHNRWAFQTYHGERNGIYDEKVAAAVKKMKYKVGYSKNTINGKFGDDLYKYLLSEKKRSAMMVVRASARAAKATKAWVHPLRGLGKFIGFPGSGTHSYVAPPNNWQSDHAWDIYTPEGTRVVAVHDGVIDQRIGRIGTGRFAGIRLYVNCPDGNEIYYAHLRQVVVKAGQKVVAGQTLGYTGSANGVPHLHIAWKLGNPLHFPMR